MALTFTAALRNARADAIETHIGTVGAAKITIYGGTAPAKVTDALSGNTVLAELICDTNLADPASGGVLTLRTISPDTSANATGTATFFRLARMTVSPSTYEDVIQGSVGTSGADLNLNSTAIQANATVSITAFSITEGNG